MFNHNRVESKDEMVNPTLILEILNSAILSYDSQREHKAAGTVGMERRARLVGLINTIQGRSYKGLTEILNFYQEEKKEKLV